MVLSGRFVLGDGTDDAMGGLAFASVPANLLAPDVFLSFDMNSFLFAPTQVLLSVPFHKKSYW